MKVKRTSKKISVIGMMLAAASIVFIIESLIPPILPFVPYVKIGLSNCFVLLVIIYFGIGNGFFFILAKNIITALFTGFFSLPYNLAGSFCAYFIMAGTYSLFFPYISLISISVIGAVFSNIARTSVAVFVMEAPFLYIQLPIVCVFSLIVGIIVGILSVLLVKYLPERLTNFK